MSSIQQHISLGTNPRKELAVAHVVICGLASDELGTPLIVKRFRDGVERAFQKTVEYLQGKGYPEKPHAVNFSHDPTLNYDRDHVITITVQLWSLCDSEENYPNLLAHEIVAQCGLIPGFQARQIAASVTPKVVAGVGTARSGQSL